MARGKIWTSEDEKILKTLWKNNTPIKVIQQTLNRNERAIYTRASHNGLKRGNRTNPKTKYTSLRMLRGNSMTVGAITEMQVFIELEKKGWTVFPPLVAGNKSDCIIKHYKTGTTHKIQIKTAWYNKDYDVYHCYLRNGRNIRYKKEDVDYYIIKCDRLDTYYIIPFKTASLDKLSKIGFYPHRIKTYQYKNRIDCEIFMNDWGVIKQD